MSAADNLFTQVHIDTSPARRELTRQRQRIAGAMYQLGRARGERPLEILAKIYRVDLPTVAARRLRQGLLRVAGYDDCVGTPPSPIVHCSNPRPTPFEIDVEVTVPNTGASLREAIRQALVRDLTPQVRDAFRSAIRR